MGTCCGLCSSVVFRAKMVVHGDDGDGAVRMCEGERELMARWVAAGGRSGLVE